MSELSLEEFHLPSFKQEDEFDTKAAYWIRESSLVAYLKEINIFFDKDEDEPKRQLVRLILQNRYWQAEMINIEYWINSSWKETYYFCSDFKEILKGTQIIEENGINLLFKRELQKAYELKQLVITDKITKIIAFSQIEQNIGESDSIKILYGLGVLSKKETIILLKNSKD